MLEKIKNKLPASVAANMPELSPAVMRWVLPSILTAAIVGALVMMVSSQFGGGYRQLFGARENVVVSDVVGVLESEGLKYRLHPETGQVLIAESDLARARMLLAAKGVVAKLPEGLELMDRNDPLGVSQFVQDVRFRRGLEGELARSIGTLDAVQSARVHLSIARSSSFVVNTGDKSSASVVLQMKPGQQLKREQIAAIIHMVSSSVAGLDPQRVALTDQAGNFLSARVDLADGFDPQSQDEQSVRLGDELRRNAQELLTAAVGAGHFRVTVAADLSQDRSEETRETYSGDPRVLSEATREEKDRGSSVALGVPGSLSNRPVNLPEEKPGADKDSQGNSRAAVSRSYAYDRSVVQIKRGKGTVQKLHVAVVLDDGVAPKDAPAWSSEEIARIEKLLRVGLGVDAQRGDQLAVSSMPFKAPEEAPAWWQEPRNWIDSLWMVLSVAGALALLLMLWKLVSSMVRALQQPVSAARSKAEQSVAVVNTPAVMEGSRDTALPSPAKTESGSAAEAGESGVNAGSMVPLMENVDLPPPGSEVDVMVEHLRSLAAKEPERVAEVVKQWVQKHGHPAADKQ